MCAFVLGSGLFSAVYILRVDLKFPVFAESMDAQMSLLTCQLMNLSPIPHFGFLLMVVIRRTGDFPHHEASQCEPRQLSRRTT